MFSEPQFSLFENVIVATHDRAKRYLNGQEGTVLGRANSDDGEIWLYSVSLKSQRCVWSFFQEELQSTGSYSDPDEFFDGSSVRVQVDSEGRGTAIGDADSSQ